MVEINWTFEEFFSAGGNTKFEDRLASVLGVHSSRIKIVGVKTGSSIIHYFITLNEEYANDPDKQKLELSKINDMLASLYASGEFEKHLGMPILRMESYLSGPDGAGSTGNNSIEKSESNVKYPVLGLLIFSAALLILGAIVAFMVMRRRSKYDMVQVRSTSDVAKDDGMFTSNKFDIDATLADEEKFNVSNAHLK
ncbi:MAG: hypothetical protein COA94_07690 [Rickettsiales bacterium]|nr:MAG: hypothetical protein COA94_07690 [Rickettsiales bacterium]